MATFAARRLKDISDNVVGILAVEWLAANQGIDFRAPLRTSVPLERAKAILRAQVSFYDKDRYFATDLEQAASMIQNEDLAHIMDESILGF